ncbi:peptidase S28 [Irpex rosettiformis]|uniref:Peptidase S28 n=1 Tax=Irpex rosettiformis TaxID=378272 RepID=A0ACB8U155_9APHY|nr:peptidase S28 [Irpex rosettiformis]
MVQLKTSFFLLLGAVLAQTTVVTGVLSDTNWRVLGPQGINLWKLEKLTTEFSRAALTIQESQQASLNAKPYPEFPAHWFTQPLDHFADSSETWRQRYWINTRHYKPHSGAPVIVIDGGETSGEDRLPFLDTGIADIVAKATGGIGVVLEHRYYGESIAVRNLTTDSLRFLNNAQSAADSANFLAHVQFPGIKENLTASNTPWLYYGGSYAGARAAHMKVLYPELVFGAIASSAVTHAALENWEYMEIIRQAADPKCSAHLENAVRTIDSILLRGDSALDKALKRHLKGLFGVADLEHDEDFVSLVESPLGAWQAKNWDPKVGSTKFEEFCEALDKSIFNHPDLLPGTDDTAVYDPETREVTFPDGLSLDISIINYAKYIRENYVSRCPVDEGVTIEQCFGTFDDSAYSGTSLDDTWRLWLFQVCTEWGYFFNAPPPGLPRIVSSLMTLEYASMTCRQAFPPGKHFIVPEWPNITAVNELGSFDLARDKLAFIDGEVDPWRPCTPHSDYAKDRPDTITRPFKVIPGGVHHWDENGLRNSQDEPPEIQKIHAEIVGFVLEWLKDWKSE